MGNALRRAAAAVRAAQHASDQLNAFLAKRVDAGYYVRKIANDLARELALAEASLLAAMPGLTDQITLDSSQVRIDGAERIEGSFRLKLED